MYSDRLRSSLPRVQELLARSAERSGRPPEAVTLVAVTKGHPDEAVRATLAAGVREIGENRVEALALRREAFPEPGIRWHMVGRLQSRKAGGAASLSQLIHSVDSLRLAHRLGREAEGVGRPIPVLIQVNTAGEESKTGFEPDGFLERLGELAEVPGLEIRGLMTMAPFTEDERVLRGAFRELRELHLEARRSLSGYGGVELSMGMSNDFTLAVEEGSTMVRLGTTLYGERPQ